MIFINNRISFNFNKLEGFNHFIIQNAHLFKISLLRGFLSKINYLMNYKVLSGKCYQIVLWLLVSSQHISEVCPTLDRLNCTM